MEKIKFGNTTYDLVPGGVDTMTADVATITFQLGTTALGAVETLLSDTANTQRIEVLDEESGLLQLLTGYTVLKSLSKTRDYLVEVKMIPAEVEGEEPTRQEVRCDVATVTLAKSDLRADVEQNAADIAYLSMMTDVALEG